MHVLQVLVKYFRIFLVTRIVKMIRAKNYKNLSKFVEDTAKILSALFPGHGVKFAKKLS